MKATGMVRALDIFGRIVVPRELRRTLDINPKDSLEVFTEDDKIMLRKYEPACIFCDSLENVISYKGKMICQKCLDHLKTI